MRPIKIALTFTVDPDGIALSQTPGGAGNLTLNGALVSGGVATLDAAQKVSITSVANETAKNFTITGTDSDGRDLSETIAGGNIATVKTSGYFKTVTQVAVDAATVGAVTVGSGNEGATQTIPADWRENPFELAIGVILSSGATLTYAAQHTLDDVQDTSSALNWLTNDSLTGKTASDDGNVAFPVRGVRLVITAFTSGTATATFIQSGSR
jgi:hypothetical protein